MKDSTLGEIQWLVCLSWMTSRLHKLVASFQLPGSSLSRVGARHWPETGFEEIKALATANFPQADFLARNSFCAQLTAPKRWANSI
jgi:hypothetical protein